jgi:hypothetical protein
MRMVLGFLRKPDIRSENPGSASGLSPADRFAQPGYQIPGTFVRLWLTGRKQPGKICRQGPVLPVRNLMLETGGKKLLCDINILIEKTGMALISHS